MANRNTLYAEIFVEALARAGLKHVVLAPGSRNTALVLAFAKNQSIRKHSHLDERSAAFYALGLALADDAPAAVVCTSGTAAANFFPAVVEAHQSRVPLIVLTVDRPPELRHSGANQTIDQIKLYGDYALWFVDAALPEASPPAVAVRNLRTLAGRVYATANGLRKGVVHINMPFRKPLEPTPVAGDVVEVRAIAEELVEQSDFRIVIPTPAPSSTDLIPIRGILAEHRRGLIIVGPRANTKGMGPATLAEFSQATGYPVLTDAMSGLRLQAAPDELSGRADAYDTFLFGTPAADLQPEVVIHIGGVPTSNNLNQFLQRKPPRRFIRFDAAGEWADDKHITTHMVQFPPEELMRALASELRQSMPDPDRSWLERWTVLNGATWDVISDEMAQGKFFDGAAVYEAVQLLPPAASLFIGNSLPARLLDQFGRRLDRADIAVYANRGASGIDGNISTALGVGAARPDRPLAAIVGDITFYHDMNGLLAVHRCGVPVTILLLNNNGGGIFHRLPIRDYDPAFTEYFLTPHGLDFSHAAKLYGLDYIRADARADFRQAFGEALGSGRSTVVEVHTDARADLARRNAVVQKVFERLSTLEIS